MNYTIPEDKLIRIGQVSIDSTISMMKEQSEEWGLGEMGELMELESIDKIVVDRVNYDGKIKFFVTIYSLDENIDYEMTIDQLSYDLQENWIPGSEIFLNEIVYL